ncbi:uncharacterized protein LTR77_009968 [Saxophila tyrrhenica]|uniref:Uncharacterized protein n=1 Tax=Saxophila tyrrhenica TaxID=1690608 RepID=A0AAV9NWL1_9PEZI|nr:hypothetical protein LTR77_009968 [Saxophila tyrrhenica]
MDLGTMAEAQEQPTDHTNKIQPSSPLTPADTLGESPQDAHRPVECSCDSKHTAHISDAPSNVDYGIPTSTTDSSFGWKYTYESAQPSQPSNRHCEGRPWRTTLFRFGPLTGLLAMLLALASMVASSGVLVGSHGADTRSWTAPPATYLAVLTAVANLCVRYACLQAAYFDYAVSLNVSMGSQLPTNWDHAGWQRAPLSDTVSHWSQVFNDTVPIGGNRTAPNNLWPLPSVKSPELYRDLTALVRSNAPLSGINGCPQTCKAVIRAPALTPSICTTNEYPVDYRLTAVRNTTLLGWLAPPLKAQAFQIAVGLVEPDDGGQESIRLVTAFYDGEDCSGILHQTACTLVSATADYNITIRDGTATLDDPGHPHLVARAHNAPVDLSIDPAIAGHPSTLASVMTQAWLKWEGGVAVVGDDRRRLAQYIQGQSPDTYRTYGEQLCPRYRDPRADVVADLNRMMVWAGMVAAYQEEPYRSVLESRMDPGEYLESAVTGQRIGDHSVYSADWAYLIAAVVVAVLCVATIAPIYWGWWTLGRPVSFSPLEIAKAFEAPLLEPNGSNCSDRDLARDAEGRAIRYGARSNLFVNGKTKLSFADPQYVAKPVFGSRFA